MKIRDEARMIFPAGGAWRTTTSLARRARCSAGWRKGRLPRSAARCDISTAEVNAAKGIASVPTACETVPKLLPFEQGGLGNRCARPRANRSRRVRRYRQSGSLTRQRRMAGPDRAGATDGLESSRCSRRLQPSREEDARSGGWARADLTKRRHARSTRQPRRIVRGAHRPAGASYRTSHRSLVRTVQGHRARGLKVARTGSNAICRGQSGAGGVDPQKRVPRPQPSVPRRDPGGTARA